MSAIDPKRTFLLETLPTRTCRLMDRPSATLRLSQRRRCYSVRAAWPPPSPPAIRHWTVNG